MLFIFRNIYGFDIFLLSRHTPKRKRNRISTKVFKFYILSRARSRFCTDKDRKILFSFNSLTLAISTFCFFFLSRVSRRFFSVCLLGEQKKTLFYRCRQTQKRNFMEIRLCLPRLINKTLLSDEENNKFLLLNNSVSETFFTFAFFHFRFSSK